MNNLEYERKHLESGLTLVAGVDEVGRGPLAGPVVCCAVIMPHDNLIDGVTDSKKLSEKVWFAGGAWVWAGFSPHLRFSNERNKIALEKCKKHGCD